MSDTERLPVDANDAELISRVRGGDVDAYGQLFSRHLDAATRLARTLVGAPDADDLVSEAFAKVLNVLLGGGGPDIAFRAYLLTAVRRLHVDKVRSTRRATPTDDLTPYDPGVPFQDSVVAGFEGGAAARAFSSLPERWQMVLWHLEVEGQKPADIAPLLGMSANSVSALAYRAREGLRQAFLQMHTADLVEDNCRWTHDKLGAYVRNGLSRRDHDKVERHLEECRRCTAIYLELAELNTSLAAVIGPLVLGGAAAAYLAGTTAGAGGLVGLGALFGRARDLVTANSQAAVAVGAATGLAAVATVGAVMLHGHDQGSLAVSEPTVSQHSVEAPTTGRSHRAGAPGGQRRSHTAQVLAPLSTPRSSPAAVPTATPTSGARRGSSPGGGAPSPVAAGGQSGQHSQQGGQGGQQSNPTPAPPPHHTRPPQPPPSSPPPSSPPPPPPALATLALVAGPDTLVATVVVPGDSATLTVTSAPQPLKAYAWSATPVGGSCSAPTASTQTCTFAPGTGTVVFGFKNPPQSGTITFTVSPGKERCTWSPKSGASCG